MTDWGYRRKQDLRRAGKAVETHRTVLLALLITLAFGGIVLVAWGRPGDLGTFSATLAGIGTLTLAFMTLESIQTQVASLRHVESERDARAAAYVGNGKIPTPTGAMTTIDVGVANLGLVPARDVRMDLLGPADWMGLGVGNQTIVETSFLPVGERLVGLSISPEFGSTREKYSQAKVRVTWWDETHGTHSDEVTIDVWPLINRKFV